MVINSVPIMISEHFVIHFTTSRKSSIARITPLEEDFDPNVLKRSKDCLKEAGYKSY